MRISMWIATALVIVGFACQGSSAQPKAQPMLAKPFYGLNFSPYLEGQSPDVKGGAMISDEQIRIRLQLVQPFARWIRTFSCGDGLENVGRIAHEMGFKTLIGAWIGKDEKENVKQLDAAIKVAKQGQADIIAIGNEVMLRGDLNSTDLIRYIQQAKKEIQATNPEIEVSTVDGYESLLKNPKIMDECDIILMNCYPFWEGVPLEEATAKLAECYQRVKVAANGKEVIISETGWPSHGDTIGHAEPSAINANKYLKSVLNWLFDAKVKCFYFSSFDESWKRENGCGPFWGIFDNNGNPKFKRETIDTPCVRSFSTGTVLHLNGIFVPSGYMGAVDSITLGRGETNPQRNDRTHSSGNGNNSSREKEEDSPDSNAENSPNQTVEERVLAVNFSSEASPPWAGIYWQYPVNNWGKWPGLKLYNPRRFVFSAKGRRGGELVEFKVGGIGDTDAAYVDSIFPARNPGQKVTRLRAEWQNYSIDLEGANSNCIIGGFCCVASKQENPQGCLFFLKNLRFEW